MTADKDDDETAFINEDEIQELLDQAEYVPLRDIFEVNETRAEIGLPFLQSRFGTYSRENIEKFGYTSDDLRFLRTKMKKRLHIIHKYPEMKKLYVQSLSRSRPGTEAMEVKKREMEEWVSAYLHDSGYFAGLENPQLFKSLFMKSFPRLNNGNDIELDGMEDFLVSYVRMLSNYLERETVLNKRWRILSSMKLKRA